MPRLRSIALVAGSLSVVPCNGCGGDYWLGGRGLGRGHTPASGADAAPSPDAEGGPLAPPASMDLTGDLVVTGGGSREIGGGAGGCRITGNGHSIRSQGTWSGTLYIHDCELVGLGSASVDAVSLTMSGAGSTRIERCTVSASGAIHVTNEDQSTTTFTGNTIAESSVVAIDQSSGSAAPAFQADGASSAGKVFAGNRVYRSGAEFRSPNWTIGGDTDAESNLLIGLQSNLALAAPGIVVRGNYVHNLHVPSAGDDSALSVAYGTDDVLAEHNVLRRGTWVIRGFGGELRYNVVLDADNLSLFSQPFENAKVHHNVFSMCEPPRQSGIQGALQVVNYRAKGIEIYANTFDGGGVPVAFTGPAISIDSTSFVDSLRSNLFFEFVFKANEPSDAVIRPGVTEGISPPPTRLGYADYNAFYDPGFDLVRNYGVSVTGHTLRQDTGFALHDAPASGAIDDQIDPRLAGFRDACFPWSDDDIKSRSVTVSEMLSHFRAAYTPTAGSPLLGTGDPVDGLGSSIGAVGDGTRKADRLGTFGR